MKHDGFRYEFTMKELAYFLLKKKACPRCRGNMTRSKGYETVDGREVNSSSDAFFVPNAKIKRYQYFYSCERCGREYTLHELAE